MRSYDFYNAFSPEEFQRFARDMVQIREGIVLESFAEGRDMGIDGRAVLEDGDTIIFQAKRMKQTGSSVLSTIQREREKLMKLQEIGIRVDRYILVMSEDLLAETKESSGYPDAERSQ